MNMLDNAIQLSLCSCLGISAVDGESFPPVPVSCVCRANVVFSVVALLANSLRSSIDVINSTTKVHR